MAGKIATSPAQPGATSDYLFHLDAIPPAVNFRRRIEITGWLFHRHGQPVHGVRGTVKAPLHRQRSYKARRKRLRPAIGAAYAHLPEAGRSGFLLEIELPLGPSRLDIQVRDQEKIWRTIFTQHLRAFPLDFLSHLRLPNVQEVLIRRSSRCFAGASPSPMVEASEPEAIKKQIAAVPPRALPTAVKTVYIYVTSKSNLFIVEIAQLICAGFREAGLAAELFVDRVPEEETPNDTIQIVVTPHEFYNLFLIPKLSFPQVTQLTRGLYLLGAEQPESEWFHSNLIMAPYARAMLDINALGVAGYRTRGLRSFHLPLGYHPMLERTNSTPAAERDVDLCLLASMTERREKFLATHADFFARRNCHLRLVPISFAKTEETKSYLSPDARNALLQRTKILLNLHYSVLRYFEWHRILVGLANGCCIITETCEGFAPLIPGKHFVMVEPQELINCCDYYLEHPAEREAIASAGRNFVREHLTQAHNCRACVRHIESGQTAWLGAENQRTEPVSTASLELDVNSTVASLWRAFRGDVRAFFQRAQRVPVTLTPLTGDEETIAQICERRRGYAERFALQEDAAKRGGQTWCIRDNEPFRNCTSPAISVVVSLYNYAHFIRACVRSVEEATIAAIPGGVEIIIVDDASTDQSLARAQRIQRDSTLPIRVVEKKFNTGLADARNIGLRLARAPYAFMMDADNLIFPRALEQLYVAITGSNATAAYSILCRFQGQPNNRTGLLSYFDWDPCMLLERPYIDAMALFDREQLLDLGGYDNGLFKVGWFGWEDYEFWLRMAAAHLRAVFVPNVLCLYRHHESSMSNTTNLFEPELVRHLIARYQNLLNEHPPRTRVFGVERASVAPNKRDGSDDNGAMNMSS